MPPWEGAVSSEHPAEAFSSLSPALPAVAQQQQQQQCSPLLSGAEFAPLLSQAIQSPLIPRPLERLGALAHAHRRMDVFPLLQETCLCSIPRGGFVPVPLLYSMKISLSYLDEHRVTKNAHFLRGHRESVSKLWNCNNLVRKL